LIEHHDAIMLRVEELPRALVGAGAGTAVQEYGRFAGRVAAFFIVDLMNLRDPKEAVPKGLECRIQFAKCRTASRGVRVMERPGRTRALASCGRRLLFLPLRAG
jgi:hypothetical protein